MKKKGQKCLNDYNLLKIRKLFPPSLCFSTHWLTQMFCIHCRIGMRWLMSEWCLCLFLKIEPLSCSSCLRCAFPCLYCESHLTEDNQIIIAVIIYYSSVKKLLIWPIFYDSGFLIGYNAFNVSHVTGEIHRAVLLMIWRFMWDMLRMHTETRAS